MQVDTNKLSLLLDATDGYNVKGRLLLPTISLCGPGVGMERWNRDGRPGSDMACSGFCFVLRYDLFV